jgi:microsomal epoxide hydrolase
VTGLADCILTDTQRRGEINVGFPGTPEYDIRGKPWGFSWFPKELAPMPQAWIETTGDLSWIRHHESGGHFAALERPETLLADLEDFIKQSWGA